ncbi:MAG: DUF1631 family protein, partial [Oleiphilaceae bacterium]|nr:DUF1631 family protein [Oleiphilaceae bacterium]
MERRSSLRKPIHLDAVLRLEGGAKWPCIIADYCDQGMFLKFSLAVSKAIESDQSVAPGRGFVVCFQGRQGLPYEIQAEPAHLLKGAAGIRFRGRFSQAVDALADYVADSQGVTHPQEEIQHIVEECIEAIQTHMSPLMLDFWPKLVSRVKEAALEASTDQLANATMEAANKIDREKTPLQQRYLAAISDPMGGYHPHEHASESVDKLSLIDKGEFEDWLTTRVLVTKAETQYRSSLLPLKMRLDDLGLSDKHHHENPLGPALVVNAFQSAVANKVVDSSIEKLFFKLFEQEVVGELGALYDELNDILIRHNVLPELNITRQIKKSPERSPAKPKNKPAPDADAAEPTAQDSIDGVGPPQFSYGSGAATPIPASAMEHSQSAVQPPFSGQPMGGAPAETSANSNEPAPNDSPASPVQAAHPAASVDSTHRPPAHDVPYQNVAGLVRSLHQTQKPGQPGVPDGASLPVGESYSTEELTKGLSA